jgi:hypothetical protein
MRRHKFGMCATGDNAHHAIARTPALRVRSQFCDFAGELESGDILRRTGRRSIPAQPLQEVCAIKRATANVYENFVRSGPWRRNILNFQYLRTTKTSYNNSSHGWR